jgi:tryptophanyl-tRNA synthetase
MSKSYGNGIFLRDTLEDIAPKVKGMFTDPARLRRSDPGNPDVCNLFPYHELMADAGTREEIRRGCATAAWGCVDCKKVFLENLKRFLEPLHERRAALLARPGQAEEILNAGNARAREAAEDTMRMVRAAVRLV